MVDGIPVNQSALIQSDLDDDSDNSFGHLTEADRTLQDSQVETDYVDDLHRVFETLHRRYRREVTSVARNRSGHSRDARRSANAAMYDVISRLRRDARLLQMDETDSADEDDSSLSDDSEDFDDDDYSSGDTFCMDTDSELGSDACSDICNSETESSDNGSEYDYDKTDEWFDNTKLAKNCHILQNRVVKLLCCPIYQPQWFDVVDVIVESDIRQMRGPSDDTSDGEMPQFAVHRAENKKESDLIPYSESYRSAVFALLGVNPNYRPIRRFPRTSSLAHHRRRQRHHSMADENSSFVEDDEDEEHSENEIDDSEDDSDDYETYSSSSGDNETHSSSDSYDESYDADEDDADEETDEEQTSRQSSIYHSCSDGQSDDSDRCDASTH